MDQLLFLLEGSAAAEGGGSSTLFLVLIYGAFFAFMWFVLIRPQRKKQKDIIRMQSEITVGSSVLTAGGLYGKVVDTVNDVLVVEFGTNKSVRIPVQRSTVVSAAEPDLTVVREETPAE